jgi:hypothetical protein
MSQQSPEVLAQLRDATRQVGGWERVIPDAKRRREDLERETDHYIPKSMFKSHLNPNHPGKSLLKGHFTDDGLRCVAARSGHS